MTVTSAARQLQSQAQQQAVPSAPLISVVSPWINWISLCGKYLGTEQLSGFDLLIFFCMQRII